MYIVEGNIGVGKTTFLSLLKKYCPMVDVLEEPVANWNKEDYGQSLLANFYQDISRWAYTLETLTMICRALDHMKAQNNINNSNPNKILERSIYSGHYCFAQNCYENGFLSNIEWKIYNQWADFLIHNHCKAPKGFIYLQADPSICFERMQKRNRSSEKAMTLKYMQDIDNRHNAFLIKKEGISESLKSVPVLILDCNEDFVTNNKNMVLHAEKVTGFLERTQRELYIKSLTYKQF